MLIINANKGIAKSFKELKGVSLRDLADFTSYTNNFCSSKNLPRDLTRFFTISK
jgi:hypothetical protein